MMDDDRDSIPEAEVSRRKADAYLPDRCGVCGDPWFAGDRPGERDHPPAALWSILPAPTFLRPLAPPDPARGWPCFLIRGIRLRQVEGLLLTHCAYLRPDAPGEVSPVVAANLPGGKPSSGQMKAYPAEVLPPGSTPPPLLPRLDAGPPAIRLSFSQNGHGKMITGEILPDDGGSNGR